MKIVLTLMFASIGIALSAQAKPFGTPEHRVAKQSSGLSAQHTTTSEKDKDTGPAVTVIVNQEKSPSNKPSESEKDENTQIQRKLADLTAWLVRVGIIQALILAFTFWAIFHQAFVTKSSERAWMIGSPNMQKFDSPPESGSQLFMYVCNLKNTGRTPARILETGLALRTSKSLGNIPQTPSYKAEEMSSLNKILLVPKDSFGRTTASQITSEEYIAVKNREMILYAYGFVKYLDVFGKPRETRFCHYYYVPGAYELQIEGFRLCIEAPPAYNMAT
jgi:hypothetical protein